jgi:stearoyl-CoA 9-desaturase NADPH oxidoreductase
MTTPPASTPAAPRISGRRLRQRITRLAELAVTPLAPSDYVDLVDPLRSTTDLRARIVAVSPETRDAVTLVLEPGRGWRPHVPGQYVRLGIDVDGVRQWRTYSLTSVPDRSDGCITVTVKVVADGIVSGHLVRRARVGDVVQLDQAAGGFTVPTPRPSKVLFVTAGSGITPVMGMLRSCLDELDDVVLVHTAPTADEVVFGGELRQLAARRRLRLVERHTATDGRLGVDELRGLVPDLTERETWACGPNGLLDALEEHWTGLGVADRLHTERFRPTVAATGEGGAVRFSRTGTTVESDGATPLLDTGEGAGVLMPSGCRMGICFGCVVPLKEGAVRDLRSGDVTTAAPGDGVLIQTCVSTAAGACDIDL